MATGGDGATPEQGAGPERMVRLLAGFEVSQALYAVAKLDIATVMNEGVSEVAEIAASTGTDALAVKRVLRTLTDFGVVEQRGDTEFVLADLGATLASNVSGSLRDLAIMLMETHYLPFERFVDTVRTGRPAADIYFGQSFFEWLNAEPERAEQFSAAMASVTDGMQSDVFSGYRLPAGELVADLGGADGSVLLRLLREHPDRRGVVHDLPAVVAAARTRVAEEGFDGRVDVVGGSFFEAVPVADVYVLSTVLHDWDDESCKALLTRIARTAAVGARLVVVEMIMPITGEVHASKQVDLTMLGMVTGRERTLPEFTDLLANAGFRLDRVVPTAETSSYEIIEATLTG
ncbi:MULTISPECIES: methyltransferase [Prauserella salsuginis group]|uniref:Methyltransferase n=1 Tax=Prauserella salsuginis TaxID=387889 RepID=A0ABW6G768_9PSEU|nr:MULTISPECIES: methyltransferase [Prauserella salsuginis group]MCR3720825.1 dimerization domain-containing protein [Prauserella flava]MCR3735094.1 dimerization domain-containing protein [Prauserella salsuginis]